MRPARADIVVAAVVSIAIALVAGVRAPAESERARAKETTESFLLPPASELKRASLGYRSALADYLWAHVLVTQGLRLGERRRFSTVTDYIDAITSLDEDFREPYLLADTLTTMQTKSATIADIREVRRILLKGTARFPNDADMWLSLGSLMVYVAPSYVEGDPEEIKRWRLEGATYMARAAELGSEDAGIAWRALGGARSLIETGERDAAIRFYQRALAVTQDGELRADLLVRLERLLGERAVARQRARQGRFEQLWRSRYPTWSLSAVLVAGPPFDAPKCAGGTAARASSTLDCVRSWSEWNERVDREIAAEQLDEAAAPMDRPAER